MKDFNIQDLIETKSFSALTENERNMVLAEITEAEYTRLSHLVPHVQLSMQYEQVAPSAAVHQNLTARFQAKHVKVNPLIQFMLLKIPIWVVLAGLISLGSVFYYCSLEKTHEPTKPALQNSVEQIFVYLRDTIYLDNPIIATYADSSYSQGLDTQKVKSRTTTTIKVEQPIARRRVINEYAIEQPLTYYDTNAVKNIDNQIRGQQLDSDMPEFEINVR